MVQNTTTCKKYITWKMKNKTKIRWCLSFILGIEAQARNKIGNVKKFNVGHYLLSGCVFWVFAWEGERKREIVCVCKSVYLCLSLNGTNAYSFKGMHFFSCKKYNNKSWAKAIFCTGNSLKYLYAWATQQNELEEARFKLLILSWLDWYVNWYLSSSLT